MKYKLLKDLPYIKAGAIYTKKSGEYITTDLDKMWHKEARQDTLKDWVVEDNPDWFAPIPDTPARWRAEKGENFFCIDELYQVRKNYEYRHGADKNQHESGNYFATREQAEAVASAFKAVLEYVHSPITKEPSELSNKAIMTMAEAHVAVQELPHA